MKPFDLQAAKRGEPIVTRDGRPVKFIAHVPDAADELDHIVVLVGRDLYTATEQGRVWSLRENSYDLFMAPRKVTLWLNVYPDRNNSVGTYYRKKEHADEVLGHGGLTIPVEVEL